MMHWMKWKCLMCLAVPKWNSTIQEMPVVSSRYWNMVHGAAAEDVKKDLEGMR